MKKVLYSVLIFTLVFSSCKKQKDLPAPDITKPEFYVHCNMDGNPLKIEAGNNDYYMNSSWYQDSTNVYTYKANLEKRLGEGYEVTILLNDPNGITATGEMDVDRALKVGQHLYNDKIVAGEIQEVNFKSLNRGIENNTWTVLDEEQVAVNAVKGEDFTAVLKVGKTYSVVLNYKDDAGTCSTAHTNVFKAGSELQTTVQAMHRADLPELQYELTYSLPSYANSAYSSFSCRWDFEDNSFSVTPRLVKKFTEGTHRVKLTLKDEKSGETCISYYQLNADYRNVCEANYVAEFKAIKNTKIPYTVIILLTDPSGMVYSSHSVLQPETSLFDLVDVTNYTSNENDQPTKRLKLKFNCVVKNGNKEINLTNGEAVVAVAHK